MNLCFDSSKLNLSYKSSLKILHKIMKKFLRLSAVLLVIFGYSTVNAKEYFDADTISPTIIDRPLKVNSKEWKDEIKYIISLQKNPDPKEIKKAEDEYHVTPEMMALEINPKLTRKNYPKLYSLLDNVSNTSFEVCDHAKKYWNTNRPYLSDKRVKPLIKTHSNNAYPSGHTTASHVFAYILGQLVPQDRQKFYDRAAEIAYHRVLTGMHFPHDVKGGKQLALLITGALFANDDFQKDFLAAKKELENKKDLD